MKVGVTAGILLAIACQAGLASPESQQALDGYTKHRLLNASEAMRESAGSSVRRTPRLDPGLVESVTASIANATAAADMLRRFCVEENADALDRMKKNGVPPAAQELAMLQLIGTCTDHLALTAQELLKDAYPRN